MIHDGWKAMTDKTRREILLLLKSRPYTAGEIADQFLLSAATVSHHLSILRDSGLVETVRRKQTIIYSLRPAPLKNLLVTIAEILPEEPVRKKRS